MELCIVKVAWSIINIGWFDWNLDSSRTDWLTLSSYPVDASAPHTKHPLILPQGWTLGSCEMTSFVEALSLQFSRDVIYIHQFACYALNVVAERTNCAVQV